MKGLLTILTLFISTWTVAQTDTVVDGKTFNYVAYYNNGQIKSLGNLTDTLKTRRWTYFKPNGDQLAYGKYAKKGVKIGKWTYHDYDGTTYKIKWSKKNYAGESFKIENDKLYLNDLTMRFGIFRSYQNGKKILGGKF